MDDDKVYLAKLASASQCYGLPYGYFGLICWGLSIVTISLTFANISLLTLWKCCQPSYKSLQLYLALPITALMVGPTVYTCLRCSAEWPVVFLAIGQLAPWSFKMLNDGFQSYKKSPTKKTRDKFYLIIGSFTTPVLTILGWVGFSTLSFYVREHWMWVIFVGGLVVPPLVIGVIWMSCGGELESATFCRMVLTIMLFIVASFHIVGSDI